jgi:hypothetical protein
VAGVHGGEAAGYDAAEAGAWAAVVFVAGDGGLCGAAGAGEFAGAEFGCLAELAGTLA